MRVTAPTGRVYDVRRRWLPWRQRIPLDTELVVTVLAALELGLRVILLPVALALRAGRILPWSLEVRDTGARAAVAVVEHEQVRGWDRSERRLRSLASDVRSRHVEPDADGFQVVITRDSVAMGDDAVDNTTVLTLDDRTAEPTVATLLTALQQRGRFVSISGPATTWVLHESTARRTRGRPLAVFVLHHDRTRMDLHPVVDTSYRVAREGTFHLEYLLVQSVERTLQLISENPRATRSLRADRQP